MKERERQGRGEAKKGRSKERERQERGEARKETKCQNKTPRVQGSGDIISFSALEIKPRVLYTVGKHSTTEQHPGPVDSISEGVF